MMTVHLTKSTFEPLPELTGILRSRELVLETIGLNDVGALDVCDGYHTFLFNPGLELAFTARNGNRYQEVLFEKKTLHYLPQSLTDAFTLEAKELIRVRIATPFLDPAISNMRQSDEFLFLLLNRITDEISKDCFAQPVYLKSLEMVCVIHLQSQYAKKTVFAPKGKLSSKQLNDVIEFVRGSLSADISLSRLAECAHLSEFHFARLFRNTLDTSPYNFAMLLKIEHAKKLMTVHKTSLRDVAHQLNFFDQAHFNNTFKRITGFSPRQFVISQHIA